MSNSYFATQILSVSFRPIAALRPKVEVMGLSRLRSFEELDYKCCRLIADIIYLWRITPKQS